MYSLGYRLSKSKQLLHIPKVLCHFPAAGQNPLKSHNSRQPFSEPSSGPLFLYLKVLKKLHIIIQQIKTHNCNDCLAPRSSQHQEETNMFRHCLLANVSSMQQHKISFWNKKMMWKMTWHQRKLLCVLQWNMSLKTGFAVACRDAELKAQCVECVEILGEQTIFSYFCHVMASLQKDENPWFMCQYKKNSYWYSLTYVSKPYVLVIHSIINYNFFFSGLFASSALTGKRFP